MTAPSLSPERHTELAEALVRHRLLMWGDCSCGWRHELAAVEAGHQAHREHLAADVLAPLVARWLAEAWDQGFREGYSDALSKPEIDIVRARVLTDAADAWQHIWWDQRPIRFEDWLRRRAATIVPGVRGRNV